MVYVPDVYRDWWLPIPIAIGLKNSFVCSYKSLKTFYFKASKQHGSFNDQGF
jgi:hypothetical protein